MSGIIAHKVGMSRIFTESGEAVPVTYLRIHPNTVIRTKSEEKDGYNAVVLGAKPKKWKTRKGKEHTRYQHQKEWQVETLEGVSAGKEITAKIVPKDSVVTISGMSKGKGFQGTMKRHNFAGGPASHGSHFKREPGSVGMKEWPGRVLKGHKMAGHMGNQKITIKNRTVLVSDPQQGIFGVKGPVPGPNGCAVYITIESAPEVVEDSPEKDAEGTKETKETEKGKTEQSEGKSDEASSASSVLRRRRIRRCNDPRCRS